MTAAGRRWAAFMESELAYETVAAGARGYLSKESAREEIGDALAAVARGGTALAPEVQVEATVPWVAESSCPVCALRTSAMVPA